MLTLGVGREQIDEEVVKNKEVLPGQGVLLMLCS